MLRFNPDYAKYGFGQWPGGVARDAFNASLVQSYTGALPLGDYIDDLQLPHMLELATKYDTEIMVRLSFMQFHSCFPCTKTKMG
jgi:alpha-L-fucosidase